MIKILFFAQMQETIGVPSINMELQDNTVGELKERLTETYPSLFASQMAMVAVNENYATEETVIQSGDTIAFIPPVSGG
ncbi:molybdopterin converting factor subunit 1 [Aureibacillus halotolerans]|uniref:Molybdopterin synthase sulfur carrier subunit n=1 Tax=Aureibacillus halotolerans TaxID=1508390 RepID=A0A4R6U2Z4_9BACI|nr:molybdopterin converting factor subunit 1 [Aureibacillus halotolerans]TDQ40740.1 molybdopterin synthase subunit MoaD [Aureibacillus halotolerans]